MGVFFITIGPQAHVDSLWSWLGMGCLFPFNPAPPEALLNREPSGTGRQC
jgi:hypothetical protein